MSHRIRILTVIKGLGLGGAEKLLSMSIPALDRDRFDYQVAYFLPWKDALVSDFEQAGIPVTCLNARRTVDFRAFRRLSRLIQEGQFDVVHAHLPVPGIVSRLAARKHKVPVNLYTEHGLWDRLNGLTRRFTRWTLQYTDAVIAVSEDVRNSMQLSGRQQSQAHVILNGINCQELEQIPDDSDAVRQELSIPSSAFVVGSVANLTPVKRHEVMLEAFARFNKAVPDSVLVMVGQLRDRDALLRDLATQLGILNRVRITGPRTDVPRLMKVFDLFTLSSRSEGLPVSLLEAMAVGLPVVCTAVGGIPDLVAEDCGCLVPPERPDLLAEKWIELAQDAPRRQAMTVAGQHRVRSHHDIEVMVRQVEQLYLNLLKEKGRIHHSSLSASTPSAS